MSIEYIPGPPTEPGEYLVVLENGDKMRVDVGTMTLEPRSLYFESEENGVSIGKENIAYHVGPFVFPEKQEPLIRMFRYEKDGKQRIGVRIKIGMFHRYYLAVDSGIEEVSDQSPVSKGDLVEIEKHITEWYDLDGPTGVSVKPPKSLGTIDNM